ncbi:unnamed protein product [Ambrosiozyma monospora]|uniref:Unnamed protein product n=1 Tax=Ambrosiozyma monospora TaxID=43982 RepID=A0A9W7DJP6_AMBMO|nr:unnamed protein product [Ambrosiozyma monospora]
MFIGFLKSLMEITRDLRFNGNFPTRVHGHMVGSQGIPAGLGKWKMENGNVAKFEIRSITGPTLTVECDTGEFYKADKWQLVTTTENLVVEKEVRLSAGNLERKLSKSQLS